MRRRTVHHRWAEVQSTPLIGGGADAGGHNKRLDDCRRLIVIVWLQSLTCEGGLWWWNDGKLVGEEGGNTVRLVEGLAWQLWRRMSTLRQMIQSYTTVIP
ncbi:hypothetical protein L1887_28294 [Cichorium endivia]|nr:hypothetical protein L1887_28294 [Cichorium endivia]